MNCTITIKNKDFFWGGRAGGELHTFIDNDRIIPIHSNDKEFFRKCREIWNKITELIGINNAHGFVETT